MNKLFPLAPPNKCGECRTVATLLILICWSKAQNPAKLLLLLIRRNTAQWAKYCRPLLFG